MTSSCEVLYISKNDYKNGWGFKKHSHPFYQIMLIISGSAEFIISENSFLAHPGDCLFFKPKEEHEMTAIRKEKIVMIDLKFNSTKSQIVKMLSTAPSTFIASEIILSLLEQMLKESKEILYGYKNIIDYYLNVIIIFLSRLSNTNELSNDMQIPIIDKDLNKINLKIVQYIQEHYKYKFTLEDMAKELNYSKNYLCQIFKKQTSMTIYDFLRKIRLQKSCNLLIYSDYNISYISEKVGFSTINHFNRLFKLAYNTTPRRYRETMTNDFWHPGFASSDNMLLNDNLLTSESKK